SRRRHTRFSRDWSSDVCSSDLEEGREMIAVAIADQALIADLDANAARLRQLADPRSIDMDDARAQALIAQSTPVYYITGALHSRSEERRVGKEGRSWGVRAVWN